MKARFFVCTGLLSLLLTMASFASDVEHVVARGETAFRLARDYGVPVDALLSMNGLSDPRLLRVGMVLKIPTIYQVKRGDTLFSIARDHGLTVEVLARINHVDPSREIRSGETLVLPRDGNVPAGPSNDVMLVGTDISAKRTVQPSPSDTPPPAAANGSAGTFWPHAGPRTALTGKLAGGTEISGNVGDPIESVSNGRVVWVGPYRGYGRVVFVQSADNFIYVYGGNEKTLVNVGDLVHPGLEVAEMGTDPRSGSALLFFFVYRDGSPVDSSSAPRE